ncbi:MAG: hypothetical protein Q9226_004571 [Calogaya cf. arnoldii]
MVKPATSRVTRFFRRSTSSIYSAFRSKPYFRFIIRRLEANRRPAHFLRDVSFFDSSIAIDPELIKTHACELLIGYQFKEPLLLWEALQPMGNASSLPQMPRYDDGNMRLAIVGDRVLHLLWALKWYPTWQSRGEYAKMSDDIMSNKSLDRMGVLNQFERYITLPDGSPMVRQKVMSATLEAIIGASYLDGNLDTAKTVAQNLGFNVLDGIIPKASFALRTRFQPTSKSVVASVADNPPIFHKVPSTAKGNKSRKARR